MSKKSCPIFITMKEWTYSVMSGIKSATIGSGSVLTFNLDPSSNGTGNKFEKKYIYLFLLLCILLKTSTLFYKSNQNYLYIFRTNVFFSSYIIIRKFNVKRSNSLKVIHIHITKYMSNKCQIVPNFVSDFVIHLLL